MKSRQLTGKKIKQLLWDFLLGLAIVAVLLAAFNLVFCRSEETFLFGYKPYIVAGESMEPVFRKYAFVIIKSGAYDDIKTGDIVAFKASQISGHSALHRVTNVTPDGLLTKGDANRIADGQLVTPDTYLGREIWHTNLTADIYRLLQTPSGVLGAVLTCAAVVLLLIGIKIIKKSYVKKAAAMPNG